MVQSAFLDDPLKSFVWMDFTVVIVISCSLHEQVIALGDEYDCKSPTDPFDCFKGWKINDSNFVHLFNHAGVLNKDSTGQHNC